jgi:hypothetical protein
MMRSVILTRIYRRIILRYFGNARNFLFWTLAVIITVYILDTYVFGSNKTASQKTAYDVDKGSNQEQQQSEVFTKTSKGTCLDQPPCPDGEYSYYIKSGADTQGQPTICFNGVTVFSPEKQFGGRGINMVIVNENTLEIMSVVYLIPMKTIRY